MSVYLFMSIWAVLFSLSKEESITFLGGYDDGRSIDMIGRRKSFWKIVFIFFAMIFFCGFRTSGVGDTRTYRNNFIKLSTDFVFPQGTSRFLFLFIEKLCKRYVSADPTVWLFIMALLAFVPMAKVLEKYCVDINLAVIIYFLSTRFIEFFNESRQTIAIWLCVYSITFLEKKRSLKFVACIIIASLIHESSLVMLLLWVLYRCKPWKPLMYFAIFGTITSILFTAWFESTLGYILSETEYSQYVNLLDGNGVNFFRTLVAYVPPILCFINRRVIDEIDNKIINLCVNASLVNALIMTVASFYNGLLFGRMASYFGALNFLLYPFLFRVIIPRNVSELLKPILILCFLIYFYYQMNVIWGGLSYISTTLSIL